ncbi:MAG: site-2 protease family protein [Bryobacteraceae bacterium]
MAKPGLADRIQLLVSSTGKNATEGRWEQPAPRNSPEPNPWWLHISLLCLTLLSTTVFGYALHQSFRMGTGLNDEFVVSGYGLLFHGDSRLLTGCAYAVPLILILLAHELGHYITCRRWGVSATLPFFGPSPTLLGTIGAFIWVKSPIYRIRSLFDIGISGPIAGFAVTLPFLITGVGLSRSCPGGQANASFVFGTPWLLRIVESARFPGVHPSDICLHPVAMAAWAGLLATAINLLPVGQLDGGHIVYALFGKAIHTLFSWGVILGLAIGGLFYWPWWVWAGAMFFFRRHPLIFDSQPLGPRRQLIALVGLLLFVLSFSPVPVRVG